MARTSHHCYLHKRVSTGYRRTDAYVAVPLLTYNIYIEKGSKNVGMMLTPISSDDADDADLNLLVALITQLQRFPRWKGELEL